MPSTCEFCFRSAREINWSNRIGGYCCLTCHLTMPAIVHTHPETSERENIMPKFDDKAEQPKFTILNGDYPFEIIKVENKISKGAKTAGSEVRTVEMAFYEDDTFANKLATIKDDLIDHPACDWKFSVLAKCVHFTVMPGEAFDVNNQWRGYRGWAHVAPEPDRQDPKKEWNRVRAFLTDKKAIPAREVGEDEIPF